MRDFILVKVKQSIEESTQVVKCKVEVIPFTLEEGDRFTQNLYQLIGTDSADVKQVTIGGKQVDVWHDDSLIPRSLEQQYGCAFDAGDGECMSIFGNLILAGCGDDGSTISCPISAKQFVEELERGNVQCVKAQQVESSVVYGEEQFSQASKPQSSKHFFAPQSNSIH